MKNFTKKFAGCYRNLIEFLVWLFEWLILFKPYWKKLLRFISTWNELLTVPLGFALFYFTPMLFRRLDPTAAGYDLGILHTIIFAIAAMLVLHGFVWFLLKITFPGVYRFFDDVFDMRISENPSLGICPNDRDKFFHITTYQKCVLSLALFSAYLFGTILLVRMF